MFACNVIVIISAFYYIHLKLFITKALEYKCVCVCVPYSDEFLFM